MFKGLDDIPKSTVYATGSSVFEYNADNPDLTLDQRRGHAVLSGLYGTLAQQEAMKEAARAGKSEFNVTINNPPQNTLPQITERESNISTVKSVVNTAFLKGSAFFMWYDTNKNGAVDIESGNEVIPTNIFDVDNKISFFARVPQNCERIEFKIIEKDTGACAGLMNYSTNKNPDVDVFPVFHLNPREYIISNGKKGVVNYELRVFKAGENNPFGINTFFVDYH